MTPFLITGCGRSGTAWAANLLTALGHPCGHEQIYSVNGPRPFTRSESSWLAMPFIWDLPSDVGIIRIMRDPYRVVQSAMVRGFLRDTDGLYERYVATHRPHITHPADHLGRVIRWVSEWDDNFDHHKFPTLKVDQASTEDVSDMVWEATGAIHAEASIAAAIGHVGNGVNANPIAQIRSVHAPSRAEIDTHPEGGLVRRRAEEFGYGE